MNRSNALSASAFVSAIEISCSAVLALAWMLLGILLSTLAVLCTQHRWTRVAGKTFANAAQNPNAPSPIARSGSIANPRAFTSSRSSAQDCSDSRYPSATAINSFLPSAVAPINTRMHWRRCWDLRVGC